MVKVESICKKYGNKVALSEVSFQIDRNKIIGVVGPNGAGKSTLLRILTGVNDPSSGKVVKEESIIVGVVFDYNGLYTKFTAYENMSFFYRLNRNNSLADERKNIEEALEAMGLMDDMNRKVQEYSKGMARKLAIARALLMKPDFLVLDEPFDGLDIPSHAFLIRFFKNWVKEEKHTIIFTSHNMSDVEDLCDSVLMIKKGVLQNNLSMFDLNNKTPERYRVVIEHTYNENEINEMIGACSARANIEKEIVFKDNTLFIYANLEKMNVFLHNLLDKGILLKEVRPEDLDLEEVYLSEFGGDGR